MAVYKVPQDVEAVFLHTYATLISEYRADLYVRTA